MEETEIKSKEKFSYSKLSTFDHTHGGCRWRYKLQYVDKHSVNASTIATEFGTLMHFVEETIGKQIKLNQELDMPVDNGLDYAEYARIFLEGYTEVTSTDTHHIPGVKELEEKYRKDWYTPGKSGMNYADKAAFYLSTGIYRLENFCKADPNLQIVGLEQEFNLEYGDYLFHGFIDRVLRDKVTGDIIVEDLKSWDKPKEDKDLKTPLQFVVYTLALQEIYPNAHIYCDYNLPLIDLVQEAGSNGYMKRGIKKMDALLASIKAEEYEPDPSALCHWCPYSATNPDQPEEAKNLCPYYSHWTRQNNKDFSVENEWFGMENHEAVLKNFIEKHQKCQKSPLNYMDTCAQKLQIAPEIEVSRRFIRRR